MKSTKGFLYVVISHHYAVKSLIMIHASLVVSNNFHFSVKNRLNNSTNLLSQFIQHSSTNSCCMSSQYIFLCFSCLPVIIIPKIKIINELGVPYYKKVEKNLFNSHFISLQIFFKNKLVITYP